MKLVDAIESAVEIALDEDCPQIVGRINSSWEIAACEDAGRVASMTKPTFVVYAWGLDDDEKAEAIDLINSGE
jgi:hypothetical protein